jgi:sugar-specific transcriptional regulator TrmB
VIGKETQQLFISLGFTELQAKVYLTVVNSGEATAKTIAATARIDRPDTYRVIDSLVQQGFIEKKIGIPLRFKALQIDEVIEILLKRKQEVLIESRKKASEILRQYQNKISKTETSDSGNFFYNLFPGKQRLIDVYSRKIIELSQENLDFVCVNIYPPIIGYEPLDDFFKRGGINRILAYNRNDELTGKVLRSHEKGAIEIRYISRPIGSPIVALVGDKKVALIIVKKGNAIEERECLFTNNPVIAELTANYFENLWNCADIAQP